MPSIRATENEGGRGEEGWSSVGSLVRGLRVLLSLLSLALRTRRLRRRRTPSNFDVVDRLQTLSRRPPLAFPSSSRTSYSAEPRHSTMVSPSVPIPTGQIKPLAVAMCVLPKPTCTRKTGDGRSASLVSQQLFFPGGDLTVQARSWSERFTDPLCTYCNNTGRPLLPSVRRLRLAETPPFRRLT